MTDNENQLPHDAGIEVDEAALLDEKPDYSSSQTTCGAEEIDSIQCTIAALVSKQYQTNLAHGEISSKS